jgi:hypothetical protein
LGRTFKTTNLTFERGWTDRPVPITTRLGAVPWSPRLPPSGAAAMPLGAKLAELATLVPERWQEGGRGSSFGGCRRTRVGKRDS